MSNSLEPKFGVATREEVAGLTGRQHLQAMMDGLLPGAPIAKTLSFTIIEIGDGFVAFEGTPGLHLLNPLAVAVAESVVGADRHVGLAVEGLDLADAAQEREFGDVHHFALHRWGGAPLRWV